MDIVPAEANTPSTEHVDLGPSDLEDADPDVSTERPVDRFRRTATGSVIAAGLFGLRDVLEGRPERDETVLVSEVPTRPGRDPLELVLDPEHPERALVIRHPPASAPDDEARS